MVSCLDDLNGGKFQDKMWPCYELVQGLEFRYVKDYI